MNLAFVPDVAYAVNGVGSKFGSGRHNQDTFVAGTLQSHSQRHGHAMSTQQAAESGQLIADLQSLPSGALDHSPVRDSSMPVQGLPGVRAADRGGNDDGRGVSGGAAGQVAPTLHSSDGGPNDYTPIVFDERNVTSKGNRSRVEAGRECHTLHEVPPAVAFNWQAGGSKAMVGGTNEYADALQSSQVTATLNGTGVRRLTPRECERLQGFPDDWTRWDADGNEMADSPRYRMMGNAVSVPPVEWIGRRIVEANQ